MTLARRATTLGLLSVLLLGPSLGLAAPAGTVLFAVDRVEIERGGAVIKATRGTTVEEGDVIATGPTAFTQLRMKDGALMSLRRGARMQIEEFRMPAPEPAATPAAGTAPPAAAGGRTVLRLFRGAFRTITGLIGKGDTDDYRVITPSATIGIRGTDYGLTFCSGDCGASPDGLYAGVSDGEIFVTNDVGQIFLSDNQYAYVKDPTTPPGQLLAPPDPLETPIDPGENEGDEGDRQRPGQRPGRGGSQQGGAGPTNPPEGEYRINPGRSGSIAFGVGPIGSADEFASASSNGIQTEGGGVVGFLALNPNGQPTFYGIGTSQNVNGGFDVSTGLRWGRWSGGTARVGDQALDLGESSLHWVAALQSDAPVMPIGGTATYTLIGNTNPTDNHGNVGFLGSATFSADFTNQTVTNSLTLGIDGQVWSASGSGSIVNRSNLFGGSYSAVSAGEASGTGSFAGFFTDRAAGAGLGYSLNSGDTSVSGSMAFGSPTSP